MHTGHHALRLQPLQIPADCFIRDPQLQRQRLDPRRSGFLQKLKNCAFSLTGKHKGAEFGWFPTHLALKSTGNQQETTKPHKCFDSMRDSVAACRQTHLRRTAG